MYICIYMCVYIYILCTSYMVIYMYVCVCLYIYVCIYYRLVIIRFFHKQRLFLFQPLCCWTSSWMELQFLLRCCLIYIRIITVGHYLYLLYLRPCVNLCLFMSYLCNRIFIFIFIFIMIHRIISWIWTHLSFSYFLEYILLFSDKECKQFSNNKRSASECCLAFAWFFANFRLALLIKVLLTWKSVYLWE